MIKYITVEIEDTNGINFKSMWCHPKSRTRMGKMPQDPMEWFKNLISEQTPMEWDSDAARERIEIKQWDETLLRLYY